MAFIPILACKSLEEGVAFYTRVLDFECVGTWPPGGAPVYGVLKRGSDELHLSMLAGDGAPGQTVGVAIEDADALFRRYRERGLDTSARPDSPVHQGPVDQTWGTREFCVADPSGNTLRFMQHMGSPRLGRRGEEKSR